MKHTKNTVKLWVGLGTAMTLGAGAAAYAAREGATPADHPGQFHGDFDAALKNILAGEGGEAGAGLSKMWPTVTAPALTGTQIKKLISGNTLALPFHYAMQFGADGSIDGYAVDFVKSPDPKACPKQDVANDAYVEHDGACYRKQNTPWKGTWKIEEHQLCVDVKWKTDARKDCWHVVVFLDRIALYDPSGTMFGKGNTLKKGKASDE